MHAPHDHPVSEFIDRCREKGLRRTQAMESVIELLMDSGHPLSATEIAEAPPLKNSCDPATVYRLLSRLEEKGILRRLGLRERSTYYALRHGHCHEDYVVCTECGKIERLEMECPVEALESQIAESSGFTNLDHELEFFGICPDCQKKATADMVQT